MQDLMLSLHVWREVRGSRAFDPLPGTQLQPLSCAEIWITHPCLASLPTLVWTCPYCMSHGHTNAHMHLENANIYCKLLPAYIEAWTETHMQSESVRLRPAGLLQASSRSRSANEILLPLDLSAGVPLNSAYNPSVHPAPLCAPLCSPALNFCQRIY